MIIGSYLENSGHLKIIDMDFIIYKRKQIRKSRSQNDLSKTYTFIRFSGKSCLIKVTMYPIVSVVINKDTPNYLNGNYEKLIDQKPNNNERSFKRDYK